MKGVGWQVVRRQVAEFESIMHETDIDALFKEFINPIIQEIKIFLEQSGYKINNFNSLYDENVEIKQLTYVSQLEIKNPVVLNTFKGCLSIIFNN